MTRIEEDPGTLSGASQQSTNSVSQRNRSGRQPHSDLACEAIAIRELEASVLDATDIGTHAVEYALHNWSVFPLRGKVPAIKGGRGVLDATTDIDQVVAWWSGPYRGANIGVRVPESMIVIDIDPRSGGLASIAELEAKHGLLPGTLTTLSGRGDGGRHLFYRRPPGTLSAARLGPGIDLKTHSGYTVGAPSIHPATGKPYTRLDTPVAEPSRWLAELLRPQQVATPAPRRPLSTHSGPSIADQFTANTSWADILEPHGWRCLDPDSDADGAHWLHPRATSACSATIKYGLLFVYSTNTAFAMTEASNPHGYTKFHAHSLLNHNDDMSAAARALKGDTR